MEIWKKLAKAFNLDHFIIIATEFYKISIVSLKENVIDIMLLSWHGTTHWKSPQLCNLSFVPNLLKNQNTVSVLAPPLVHDSTSANLDLLIQIYAFSHEPYFNFLQLLYSIWFSKYWTNPVQLCTESSSEHKYTDSPPKPRSKAYRCSHAPRMKLYTDNAEEIFWNFQFINHLQMHSLCQVNLTPRTDG